MQAKGGAIMEELPSAKAYRRGDRKDRWYVQLRWQGRRYVRYYYDAQTALVAEALADQLAKAITAEIRRKGRNFNPDHWFTQTAKEFLFEVYAEKWFDRQELAPSYYDDVKRCVFKHLIPFFGKMDLRDIQYRDIEDFLASLPKHLSPKSRKNILGVLRTIFGHAYRREEIVRIPGFPEVKVPEPDFRWISAEWQKKILERIDTADRPIFLFLRLTACRPGEARALKWDCVDFENHQIHIRRAFSRNELRETTKTRRNKPIPMTKLLLQLLSVQREKAKVVDVNGVAQGFVFVNTSGRPYSDHLWEIWNEARDKVKAPKVTMYQGTRHSRGTQLLEQGWDMAAVQDLLGHTRPDMTKRYAKWAATSKMGKMLEEADRGWEVESEEKASRSNDLRDFPVTTGT